jgi:A/G-specific adenine glycosylase
VYEGTLLAPINTSDTLNLVDQDEIESFAFPVSHQKMLRQFYKKE